MTEQRKSVRFARILTAEGSEASRKRLDAGWLGRVLNISHGGVGLHVGERLEVGTLLSLKVEKEEGNTSLRRQAKVVHATRQDNDTWIVGAEWLRPLNEEELQELLG